MGEISSLQSADRRTKVVVATTVLLGFISFWRAAAIVLNDLASSAYNAGGIAEQAAGKSAPWFILGVMLFSYAVRAVYVESCAMFTRGGVYRVVKEAMGGIPTSQTLDGSGGRNPDVAVRQGHALGEISS